MNYRLVFCLFILTGCKNSSSIDFYSQSGISNPAVTKVRPGNGHICALYRGGKVRCWGYGTLGALGTGLTDSYGDDSSEAVSAQSYVNLGTGRTALDIDSRQFHSCALLDNHSVKCWGANNYSQLGLGVGTTNIGTLSSQMGDNLPAVDLGTGRTAKAISVGVYHTCAILDDDSLKCWGSNTYGELGIGSTDSTRGALASGMGDNLPAVDFGAGRTVKAVSAGYFTTCAILDDDSLKCFGYNSSGQLGLGDTAHRGRSPSHMGASLPSVLVGTGTTVKSISAAVNYTCALLSNDTIKCWGQNTYGQLGLGDTTNRGSAAGEMGDNLPAVDLGAGGATPISFSAMTHSCVLLNNNKVKCWGYNTYADLGNESVTHWGTLVAQMGTGLLETALGTQFSPTKLFVGGHDTCTMNSIGQVKCWGANFYGQLGLGDANHRGDGVGEMGDDLPLVDVGE